MDCKRSSFDAHLYCLKYFLVHNVFGISSGQPGGVSTTRADRAFTTQPPDTAALSTLRRFQYTYRNHGRSNDPNYLMADMGPVGPLCSDE